VLAAARSWIDDLDHPGAIVVALQLCVAVAFDVRGVSGAPVHLPVPVADDMKCESAERIAPPLRRIAWFRRSRARRAVHGVDRANLVRSARRERQAVAVVDGSAHERSSRGEQPGIVLEPVPAVGLFGEARRRREVVGAHDLNPRRPAGQHQCGGREDAAKGEDRLPQMDADRRPPPGNREHDADGETVRQHR
jgi:hypothetical protein